MSSEFAGRGDTTTGPLCWPANGTHREIFPNDPYDVLTALHDWLNDRTGRTAGNLAYYCVPYGLGVNLSHRTGSGDLFRNFSDLAQAPNWEQSTDAMGQIVLGPPGSGLDQHWKYFRFSIEWATRASSVARLWNSSPTTGVLVWNLSGTPLARCNSKQATSKLAT